MAGDAAACDRTSCDTRAADMRCADARRTNVPRADTRGTGGTRTTSGACRKAAVPAAMTPDSRAVTPSATPSSAGVSFERQERNHEKQRRSDASAGRQQRPHSAME